MYGDEIALRVAFLPIGSFISLIMTVPPAAGCDTVSKVNVKVINIAISIVSFPRNYKQVC